MKNFFKWYFDTWRKKDMTGEDCILMCWVSVFIILGVTGIFILGFLIFKYYFINQ